MAPRERRLPRPRVLGLVGLVEQADGRDETKEEMEMEIMMEALEDETGEVETGTSVVTTGDELLEVMEATTTEAVMKTKEMIPVNEEAVEAEGVEEVIGAMDRTTARAGRASGHCR